LIGSAGITLSIIELFNGRPNVYHYDESQGGLKIENPLWPSSDKNRRDFFLKIFSYIHCILGKGFWVSLVLIATGLVCILTSSSFVGFTTLSGVSTILSFYLLMTCIIPVQYDTKYSDASRLHWQFNELILNTLLIAVGGFGIIVGVISTLIGSIFAVY
jgi:hypothetical protein